MNINKDLIIYIIDFLNSYDIFIIKEINKEFYNIIMYMKTINNLSINPSINNLHISHLQTINLIKWGKTHNSFKYTNDTTLYISKFGNLELLEYVIQDGCIFNNNVYYEASKNGYFNIVNWCFKNNYKPTKSALIGACCYGDLNIIKWMIKNNFPISPNEMYNKAAFYNNLNVIKFLLKEGYKWSSEIYDIAAIKGNLKILKFLNSKALHDLSYMWWSNTTSLSAAESNNLNILKYVIKNGCKWHKNVLYKALENKNVEMLKWSIDNKCPIDQNFLPILKEYIKF